MIAMITLDANEAVADVAYRLNEIVAIYPITPASPMGEHADDWAAQHRPNLWGMVPQVIEMQSEGGAAGAVHGALQGGALTTTFTASQGLLLMIPNLYKIAGELTPCVIHVAARTLATHALSIFGDHSDVYAARNTGFAMLAASSVEQAQDFALIAQAASLRSRVPFLHFFDGFRTSHEIAKIAPLSDDDLRALIDQSLITEHRRRALSPEHPVVRGTAQNPDTFFQAREAVEPYYQRTPEIVQELMDRFAERTGRQYRIFEYAGHPEAERVIVIMGSGAETARETIDYLVTRGERVGVLVVHLYRPFAAHALVSALPTSVRAVAVLDRSKEPGASGEPLYLDVVTAFHEHGRGARPIIIGGRYGLSSKELTPAMLKGVLDELTHAQPRQHVTVGIMDDVSGSSITYDESFRTEPDDVMRCVFYGLGADGTVGANKNSIKIIGEETEHYVQGYFVYDSKKSGAQTVSHLRISPRPIRSAYLIDMASFVACHQWQFLERYDVLERAAPGAVFLLNAPYGPDEVWDQLPRDIQQEIIDKHIEVHVIDAYRVAEETGLGRRINTVMQTCFFALTQVVPLQLAMVRIKQAIEDTYGKRGPGVVQMNIEAVDSALAHLHRVKVPRVATSRIVRPPIVPEHAPDFVQRVTAVMLAGKGDRLPVSAFTPDGTWPVGTSKWEKRNIARQIPVWDAELCIQCNKCALVCPHATVRVKAYPTDALADAPPTFKHVEFRDKGFIGYSYTVQIAPEDCTGCTLCVAICPAQDKAKSHPAHKALEMADKEPLREAERDNYDFFLALPELDRRRVAPTVKHVQLLEPLFEYSGACAGCGETPYLKLLTQLFGDRLTIANATGCSSIFGGNLPTTPYTVRSDGRGPAWANSLFEDNAEFGLGLRAAFDHQREQARSLVCQLVGVIGDELAIALLAEPGTGGENTETYIAAQRERVARLRSILAGMTDDERARRLMDCTDCLVPRSVWIVGGDGWAYDIGYGGLDHVLASGKDVNILVLDTEVYSNTGGQSSKSTPLGATAKFSASGKERPKKDLGLHAMAYGDVYVAQVALGAKDQHALKAFMEAASYPGPSLIIAYSHCIAHGYDLAHGLEQQTLAVKTGYWPLYRFDPRLRKNGEFPLHLDSPAPTAELEQFACHEARFQVLKQSDPERAKELMAAAQREVERRYALYRQLAQKG